MLKTPITASTITMTTMSRTVPMNAASIGFLLALVIPFLRLSGSETETGMRSSGVITIQRHAQRNPGEKGLRGFKT